MRIDHGLLPGHVLQRTPKGASATITGACSSSGNVIARVVTKAGKPVPGFAKVKIGAAGDGSFTARLKGLPVGGPYVVELSIGAEKTSVRDVFVGDLWLMAGQSNMQGIGNLDTAPKPHPLVRNFSMAREWELAQDPLHCLNESPDVVHNGGSPLPKAARAKARRSSTKGTGVGVYFGRLMAERSGVPQGLIATAHGGTSMAQWDPSLRDQGGASLYGSMWLSLQAVGQPIAGMLWYQGESDAQPPESRVYTAAMQRFIAALRADLRQPALPVVVVQIGRVVRAVNTEMDHAWNDIQDQQRRLPSVIPHLDVVPTVDLDLDDLIHISGTDYAVLGQRLAHAAARLCRIGVQRGLKPTAIQPLSAEILDRPGAPTVAIRFSQVVGSLRSAGRPLGFAVVDGRGQALPIIVKTSLKNDRVELELTTEPTADMRIAYGLGTDPVCTITDERGMGLPVFTPMQILQVPAISGWFLGWTTTGLRSEADVMAAPQPTLSTAKQSGSFPIEPGTWFVNEHATWAKHQGHQGFATSFTVAEAMACELRLGYDGPIRVWLDGREIHTDPHGTNPIIKDHRRIPVKFTAGSHELAVLMGLNGGAAWGFCLRFARPDAKLVPDLKLPVERTVAR